MNLSLQALRHNQWQPQPSYSLMHRASTEYPIAHWTTRKTLLMRAPTQVFVQQRNWSLTTLSHSFIKTTVSRGKHISFGKHERMVLLSFYALGPMLLPSQLSTRLTGLPSIYDLPACTSLHSYCLPACRTSSPTYLIAGAVSGRILIKKVLTVKCRICSKHSGTVKDFYPST